MEIEWYTMAEIRQVVAHTGINDKDIEEGTLGRLPLY